MGWVRFRPDIPVRASYSGYYAKVESGFDSAAPLNAQIPAPGFGVSAHRRIRAGPIKLRNASGRGAVGSAPALGAGGRGFEPRRPDHERVCTPQARLYLLNRQDLGRWGWPSWRRGRDAVSWRIRRRQGVDVSSSRFRFTAFPELLKTYTSVEGLSDGDLQFLLSEFMAPARRPYRRCVRASAGRPYPCPDSRPCGGEVRSYEVQVSRVRCSTVPEGPGDTTDGGPRPRWSSIRCAIIEGSISRISREACRGVRMAPRLGRLLTRAAIAAIKAGRPTERPSAASRIRARCGQWMSGHEGQCRSPGSMRAAGGPGRIQRLGGEALPHALRRRRRLVLHLTHGDPLSAIAAAVPRGDRCTLSTRPLQPLRLTKGTTGPAIWSMASAAGCKREHPVFAAMDGYGEGSQLGERLCGVSAPEDLQVFWSICPGRYGFRRFQVRMGSY